MLLKSLKDCQLSIGSYPIFQYDATGGGGKGLLHDTDKKNIQHIRFNKNEFSIPPLNWKTTKLLSLPIPPGINIKISLKKLEGKVNQETIEINLDLEARFILTIFSIIKLPYLSVNTLLSNKKFKSTINRENPQGRSKNKVVLTTLLGETIIPATGNVLLDSFLGLPNKAEALLKCEIDFQT
tara:strand:- start:135 stop:680 length:546 start_codon:yes stop_codon:yes gene_type:complete